MSVSVTVAGVSYTIPQVGDTTWGVSVTSWIQAISAVTLQTSGGSFTLTSDLNFGASFGVISKYFTSASSNAAASGAIRLANGDGIGWRNVGNTDDLLLKPDADGFLQYNNIDLVNLSATQTLSNKTLGSTNTATGITMASFTPDGSHTLTPPSVTDTLAVLAAAQTFTNKTIAAGANTISGLTNSNFSGSAGIANANLASMSAGTLKANITGGGAVPTDSTLTAIIDALLGNTQGDLLYRGASAWAALAPGSSGQALVSGGPAANPSWSTVATNPMTIAGQMIYGGASGAPTAVSAGSSGQVPISAGTTVAFGTLPGNSTALKAASFTTFTSTGSTTGYLFTISTSTTCAVGDTYTNNGNTYTVIYALSAQSGQVLFMSNSAAPLSSGTLTRATGAGTASVTFTANLALGTYTVPTGPSPLYLIVEVMGGGGGGGGSGTSGTGNGTAANSSAFGPYISGGGGPGLIGSGGAAQGGGAGGTASSAAGAATISFPGGAGQGSIAPAGTPAGFIPGGSGGNGFFGGAGQAPPNNNGTAGATNTGSGGSGGGGNSSTFAGSGGGAGAYSRIIINSALASTYPYAIGAGGSAGGAGTSGNAGGAGAAGFISILVHYQ